MLKQGLKMGLHALGTYFIFMVVCLLLCSTMGEDYYWIQVVLNLMLLGGMGALMVNDGGYRGEKACTAAATMERMEKEGKQVPDEMRKTGFFRGAALVAYLTVAIPLLALAGVNLAVEPYYPAYVAEESDLSFEEQSQQYLEMTEEERAALTEEAASHPINWTNVAARAVFMPYVAVYHFFEQNPHGLNLIFVLFALLSALPESIGYLCGPSLRKRKLTEIQKGKKRKMKKLKVHQAPKEPRKPKMEV